MRIDELTLIAYGKFTDHRLVFPRTGHDLHVIVGPNEAGKSTVRRAISEWLFGIERQSALGFLHPQSDLRIGGVLGTAQGPRPFIRSKQVKSVRSLADEPMPDGWLAALLGGLTADSFAELHCLDHPRLLEGGQGIVDPRNSVSQILFQAASGVEGFAVLRDGLAEAAGRLFSPRGKNNAVIQAHDRLIAAQRQLKDAQVRAQDWVKLERAWRDASAALQAETRLRRERDAEMRAWERRRRVAPLADRLQRLEAQEAALGETRVFPGDARQTLDHGIQALGIARSQVETRRQDQATAEAALAALAVDTPAIDHAEAIERLAQLSDQYADHEKDLPQRLGEVERWLAEALTLAAPFGWGQDETTLRANLPAEPVLQQLESRIREHGILHAERRAADEAVRKAGNAITDLKRRLAAVPERAADRQLAAALTEAREVHGQAGQGSGLRGARAAVQKAEAILRAGLAALNATEHDIARLRALPVPSSERIAALQDQRRKLVLACEQARAAATRSEETVARLALEIAQFTRSHKIVTVAEVSDGRLARDALWRDIVTGHAPLAESAARFEAAIRLADELADARTLSETDAASLQAMRHQLEAVEQDAARQRATAEAGRRELDRFDADWTAVATAIGCPVEDMPLLEDVPTWLERRETVLTADEALAAARIDAAAWQDRAEQARNALREAVRRHPLDHDDTAGTEAADTTSLIALADTVLARLEAHRTMRELLGGNLHQAEAELREATRVQQDAAAALGAWRTAWRKLLVEAHLPAAETHANPTALAGQTLAGQILANDRASDDALTDVTTTEMAITAARSIRQWLDRIEAHRRERIGPMRADLAQLAKAAADLTATLAPDLAGRPIGELRRKLDARLRAARQQADRRTQARAAVDAARQQLGAAEAALRDTARRLAPVLQIAGVEDPVSALPLVERSDRKATLRAEIAETRHALEAESAADGLSLAAVYADLASHPVADAPLRIAELADRMAEAEDTLQALARAEFAARQAFDRIDGGDEAAQAESARQQALADLTEAGENYLHLTTAGTLLRWAVDRYRDRRQGPMLERASGVFRQLTEGSFDRLRIDYDQTPPVLLAYRPDGQAVRVAGLSDGSRDQLFLALRIAALELQAEQGEPIPFIADDLFINFDDQRARAGLMALHTLSSRTQVLLLTHQEHLVPDIRRLLPQTNVITLAG